MEEANLLTNYLFNRDAKASAISKYREAMEFMNVQLDSKEQKIWKLILQYPFLIHFFDAALAFKNPDSGIRLKIFTMLSILECEPEFAQYFLPKKFHFTYLIRIGITGILSIVKLIIGLILLSLI